MPASVNALDLFLVAGESSGDLQGACLLQALYQRNPSLRVGAVAGPKMRSFPLVTHLPMESLQVMGFFDVFKALPRLALQFFRIRREILRSRPKIVVCIDYPGFNLRLENSLRKQGYRGKLIHLICPTVWAWGKHRIAYMERNLDELLSILPFEKEFFSQTKLSVTYIGHPLTSLIPPTIFQERPPILALFPGSRNAEIERNFPLQLQIARKLQCLDPTLSIHVSIAHQHQKTLLQNLAPPIPLTWVEPEQHYDLMRSAHLALATSGTVTLELALHQTPTVVQFAIRRLDQWIAQRLLQVQLPYYCLVNLLASDGVFPEFFGSNLTPESLYRACLTLWTDKKQRKICIEKCQTVRTLLGEKEASSHAAKQILKNLHLPAMPHTANSRGRNSAEN